MIQQSKTKPHQIILERDPQYRRGFPEAIPLPPSFLPETELFQPKAADIVFALDSDEINLSTIICRPIPIEHGKLQLKKWLMKEAWQFEEKERIEARETGRKPRKFSEVTRIRLKVGAIICERVKQKRTSKNT